MDYLSIYDRTNGPEFTSKVIQKWLDSLKVGPLLIEPGSTWKNGYNESFNGKRRDELNNEVWSEDEIALAYSIILNCVAYLLLWSFPQTPKVKCGLSNAFFGREFLNY
jgi:transposase InsO family protein